VFGDVYRIDLLTTTVWEAGGPDKPVQGAQPTGALITFPNSEVLRSNIVNYTRDFAYVWDEVTVGVANESDLAYSMRVARETAKRVIGEAMAGPVEAYRAMLEDTRLPSDIADEPQAYLSQTDAWTNITIRYLVAARERRRWATALILALAEETGKPEHRGKIIASYPSARIAVARDRDWQPGESQKNRTSGG
jgi:small-conductance mechanosensitive channel